MFAVVLSKVGKVLQRPSSKSTGGQRKELQRWCREVPIPRGDRALLLTIREQNRLVLAVDRIHDRWFDVEAITYDSGARAVSIPFWSRPTARPPISGVVGQREPFDDLLVVHEAQEPRVEDRERIGTYTFNDILVRANQLLIRAEPNLRIVVAIASLHITIGETEG